MTQPVDLLLLTCNRRPYVERTLERLLSDPTDMRIHWWDNHSTDGAADVVSSCKDPRIVRRHISPENVMQDQPVRWLLEHAKSDLIGKIDDDTLLPPGWIETIGGCVREHEELAMVGCWMFWPEDFTENERKARRNIVQVGRHQILRSATIGGTGFLLRKTIAQRYLVSRGGYSIPFDRLKMTIDGLISGWYFPFLWAEHMDDPRSGHCLMNRAGGMGKQAALTAQSRSISTPEAYLEWTRGIARHHLTKTVRRQVFEARWRGSLGDKILRKVLRRFRPQQPSPAKKEPAVQSRA